MYIYRKFAQVGSPKDFQELISFSTKTSPESCAFIDKSQVVAELFNEIQPVILSCGP